MNYKDYIKAMDGISISQEAKDRIKSESIKLNHEKEKYNMKFKKRLPLLHWRQQ